MNARARVGRVEAFDPARGFGFLRRFGDGRRHFFRLDDALELVDALPIVGEVLEFTSTRDGRRYRAVAIARPQPAAS